MNIRFAHKHLDELIVKNFEYPKLTKEKLKRIKENIFAGKIYEIDKFDDENKLLKGNEI
ncbi:MAG: hypothetical protein ACTSVV_04375 [Promethearchaeota archaeon]